jgi:hypothetical protein
MPGDNPENRLGLDSRLTESRANATPGGHFAYRG